MSLFSSRSFIVFGLTFRSFIHFEFIFLCMVLESVLSESEAAQPCLTLSDSMDCSPPDFSIHRIFQARILEWVAISFSRGIFPTQGSNSGVPHCKRILYQLSHKGSPIILEWVAYPFSRGSVWPRDRTGVSCIAGRFHIPGIFLDHRNRKINKIQSLSLRSLLKTCKVLHISCMIDTEVSKLFLKGPERKYFRLYWPKAKSRLLCRYSCV